jgi:tellurite resistance protein
MARHTPISPISPISASLFSVVLGMSGIGQAWRVAVQLWQVNPLVGKIVLLSASLIWLGLLIAYISDAIRNPARVSAEFRHPVAGGTPALLSISTLLICQAVLPYSRSLAWVLAAMGISWHLFYSIWHMGTLWQGGRQAGDTTPSLYLPTVASSFTTASALGALGFPEWGWLFLGVGAFSWLTLESMMFSRLWHDAPLPAVQRPLLGIQFAPPVVCSAAILVIAPNTPPQWLLMLLGYSLFQMIVGLRLKSWMGAHPFGLSWWSFSFGVVSATVTCLKLALENVPAASTLALPVFIGGNLFIAYLCVRTLHVIAGEISHATRGKIA